MSDEDRAEIERGAGRYVDIAVMGGFFKQGIKAPMLVAGEDAAEAVAWMNDNGFVATLLGPKPGSASSVKMIRSTLVKGSRRWASRRWWPRNARESSTRCWAAWATPIRWA